MEQKRQLPSLTALKGIFILIIAVHNTLSITPLFSNIPGSAFIVLFGGKLGNSMFFMLSGYLISCGYRKRIESHQLSFRDYLVKRLRKLYPMYFITNIAALILAVLQYGMSAINLKKIAFTLLLQNGGGLENSNPYNSPTWFLSALFVCYIVFYVISYYAKTPTQYSCAVVLGVIWGYTLLQADLSVPFCYSGNGQGFMSFFIGCALAELYPMLDGKNPRWLSLFSILALGAALYLLLRYGVEIICGDVDVAFAFVICPMILYLAMNKGICEKVLRLKPLVYLGKVSSSIFFWHLVLYLLFLFVCGQIAPGESIQESQYLVYAVLMLAWSILSYEILEKRLLSRR